MEMLLAICFWGFLTGIGWKYYVYIDCRGVVKHKGRYWFVRERATNNEFKFDIGFGKE